MTTTTTIQQLAKIETVTRAQIEMCERIIDNATGQAFFSVRSEHYDDNYTEYTVKAITVAGRYFLTCSCAAGLRGIACKHKVWAAAAAQVHKSEVKALAMARTNAAPVAVDAATVALEMEKAKVRAACGTQEAKQDDATITRVALATLHPRALPAAEVERDARRYRGHDFSLLRR